MLPQTTPRAEDLKRRLIDFMNAHIYPAEKIYAAQLDSAASRWSIPPVMEALKAKAREAGLWNLFMPRHEMPDGLTNVEYAVLCEEMGRSPIAPEACLYLLEHPPEYSYNPLDDVRKIYACSSI
jgi:acyl-CoA dehydrogenase